MRNGIEHAQVTESRAEDAPKVNKLMVQLGRTQTKIEVTPVMRGCVYEPEQRSVSVEAAFGFAEIKVLSFADLSAGKIVAALDRQHPRARVLQCLRARRPDRSPVRREHRSARWARHAQGAAGRDPRPVVRMGEWTGLFHRQRSDGCHLTGMPYSRQNTVEARWVDAPRMRAGMEEVRASGNLQGKPAIILHGRSDPLLPPNHTSRAYVGLNKSVEGERSRLSYVEVDSGNHFDSFIPLFDGLILILIFGPNTLIPMHYYFEQALNLMRDHLLGNGGTALPPSQVLVGSVANKPWDTLAKARLDMPDLASSPPPDKSITFSNRILSTLRLAVFGCA